MAWSLPRLLRRLGAALVHTQYALPLRCPCPAVVTIHDLSFERDPGLDEPPRPLRVPASSVPRAARARGTGADRVRALEARPRRALRPRSRRGRRDAERRRPRVPAGRRRGRATTSSRSVPCSRARTSSRRSRRPRRSGSRSSSSGPRRTPPPPGELRERGATLRGYVEIDELAALYRGAACLVQASHYEGFGLPVLEAMASGTPVVIVRDAALMEVAGDAAVVVDEDRPRRGDPPCARRPRGARCRRPRACTCLLVAGCRRADGRRLP